MIKLSGDSQTPRALAYEIMHQIKDDFKQPLRVSWELTKLCWPDHPDKFEMEKKINIDVRRFNDNLEIRVITLKLIKSFEDKTINYKIRLALRNGFNVMEISKGLDIKYQRVKNVEKQVKSKEI